MTTLCEQIDCVMWDPEIGEPWGCHLHIMASDCAGAKLEGVIAKDKMLNAPAIPANFQAVVENDIRKNENYRTCIEEQEQAGYPFPRRKL